MDKIIIETNGGGLGEKLLSMVGSCVICHYLKLTPHINFNKIIHVYPWGDNIYDTNLFYIDISNVSFINDTCSLYNGMYKQLYFGHSVDVAPYNVYLFLKKKFPEINYNDICETFKIYASKIKPTKYTEQCIPLNLENTYAVHLRKTDKVSDEPHFIHEQDESEFQQIILSLLNDLYTIIDNENNPSFLLVSEDLIWKNDFQMKLVDYAKSKGKDVSFASLNIIVDSKILPIIELFSLSKCKRIYQGVKVSTFSTFAALHGSVPIVNYAYKLCDYNKCFIHVWKSIVEINGEKNRDLFFFKEFFTNDFKGLIENTKILYHNYNLISY